MKKTLLFKFIALGLFMLFGVGVVNAQTTILQQSFESETGYTVTPAFFTDGYDDYFLRGTNTEISMPSLTGIDGSYFIAAEDINGDNSYSEVMIALDELDVSGYSNVQVKIALAASELLKFDDPDYIIIEYDKNNSGTYTILGAFYGHDWANGDSYNGPMREDTNLDGFANIDGTELGLTFQDFTYDIAGDATTIDVRVRIAVESGDEEAAIDNIRIEEPGADTEGPALTSVPNDGDTDVAINTSITLTFDEAIRNIDDSEITDANVAALLTFKETDATGADVPFTATIDVDKKVITATPDADLKNNQLYYGAIDTVEDELDNAAPAGSMTFTTIALDTDPPTFTSVPTDTDVDVAVNTTITFTFDEAIRNIDDSEITDLNVAALLTFKETDESGTDVAFTATIDVDKKIITVTPDADLTNSQAYYAAFAAVEDEFDNASTGGSLTFTTVAAKVTALAQVFITELADPGNNSGVRYIELFNAGVTAIDFTEDAGWRIDKYTNESPTVSQTLSLTGTIPAKGFYIIATGTDDGDFFTAFGVNADQFDLFSDNVAGSNGDDNLELYNGSNELVDQFGVPGEDGSGTSHEFEDGRAERIATVTASNPVWDFAEWNIWNDTGDGGTTNDPQDAPDDFDPGAWIGDVLVATDLFFSEYIEGSGNNKAIEIFNGTGAEVDLSAYAVKQSHNGTGWGVDGIAYVLPLTGTLANGDVYVISASDASEAILDVADLALVYGDEQGNKIPFFTGDDAMGLFKDDVLIDLIGVVYVDPGTGWDVAGVTTATADHTLVRKGTVTQGNTDWTDAAGTDADDSEWLVMAVDVFSFLGDHYFGEAPVETTYAITFNVDMSLVEGFDPNSDIVYISGDIVGWAEPGSNAEYALTDTDGNMIYSIVIDMDIPGGDIAYKFFINAGWNTWGEWVGGDDRTATITESTILDHIFGNQGEAIVLGVPFIQRFDYITNYADVSLAGWTNTNTVSGGTLYWIDKVYYDDKYVQISSYSSTSTGADEAWLITPGVDMDNSTGEELSFDVNIGYWTHDGLTVKISTDFDQTVAGITTATWTDVTADFTIPSEPSGSYGDFATAGHLDVSSYTGTMYVAFVYNGDKAASETTTYQIDNVVIAEAGTVGIDDVLQTELNIYPNPSNGKFYIQMGDAFKANTKIEVFNVVGMKVYETLANDYKTEIDLSSMKQGVYYVRVDDGANILTQKIMKQ